ncbi:prepilin-type N-terminal cleavage/methylation domain-containing protein [Leptospira wolffii]|uniref:type II secretion system protein GspG n=1 Tax=Leptospira wolffii TaxID=409998 RepID=UPI0010837214|nr:type II secretion system protein GspG [Leptospira wolffii]TGK56693.1 prepilin-type N-terminal cleavage/methylation domain-containing protein [Leptospira wolffii]TGK71725.1 prepilin-type N-terminal cleavage/methylation domain-containing protein [Leptospira wolffii]TGK75418.1 prepilin-type N-terminal cleavage/methylation domain-containing protein [Leptospira wolffii]TGL33092.1 prepilin-type N-terminal cleavage/methylation domain-containing protein [Leptospira wolffii]
MKTGKKRREGFTLIELAIVVAILGALMAIIIVNIDITGVNNDTAALKLRKDKQELRMNLERYSQKFGNYPTEDQGLEALAEKPTTGDVPEDWRPMVNSKDALKDPWKNLYKLRFDNSGEIQIFTYGRDGQEGGEGENTDFDILKDEDYPPQFAKK